MYLQLVSGSEIRNADELKISIINAFDIIKSDRDTLLRVKNNVIRRVVQTCASNKVEDTSKFQHLL